MVEANAFIQLIKTIDLDHSGSACRALEEIRHTPRLADSGEL